jgi:hypothetical protein
VLLRAAVFVVLVLILPRPSPVCFSDTFVGIAPAGVLAFIAAQLIGTLPVRAFARWLWWNAA